MNSENLSHTIYRDQDIHGRKTASTHTASRQLLGMENDRAERFEVLLRVLLVVCVGAAMLTGGTWTHASAPATDCTAQGAPVVQPSRVAIKAAVTLLPKAMERAAEGLR